MQDKRDHFGIFVTAQVILVLFYKYGGAGNGFIIFYQVFTLAASLVLLKIDFGQKIWRTRLRTGARAIVRGAVCGTFFAAGALAVMYVFFTIVLFPAYIRMLPLEWIVLAVARQLLIAFSEEALFRFYLPEALKIFLRGLPYGGLALLCSLIFALIHLVLNGLWQQFLAAFAFGMAAFLIRRKQAEAIYLQLSVMHFVYNMFALFVFTSAT